MSGKLCPWVMAAVALMVRAVLQWLSGNWAVSLVAVISESYLVSTDVVLFFITDACPFSAKTMNSESERPGLEYWFPHWLAIDFGEVLVTLLKLNFFISSNGGIYPTSIP